jgi:peptidoglycan-associated lipoprotein
VSVKIDGSRRAGRRRFLWLVVALPVVALAVLLAGSLQNPDVSGVVAAPLAAAGAPAPAGARYFVANPALGPVYFGAGRSTPTPEDRRILDAHLVWLKRNGGQLLLIEGHTDGPGLDPTSVAVGEQRAAWAKTYLVTRGVDANRIETISYGGTLPTCSEKTAECRARNRRATFSTMGR